MFLIALECIFSMCIGIRIKKTSRKILILYFCKCASSYFHSHCHFLRYFFLLTFHFLNMNDPHYRLIYLLLLYMQYVIINNNMSILVILFTYCYIICQECQVVAMKRKLRIRIKWSKFYKLLSTKQFCCYFQIKNYVSISYVKNRVSCWGRRILK